MEGRLENGNPILTEGGLIVSAKLEYKYQGQVFVVVVPVYYSIGAGGSIELTAGMKGMVVGKGMKPMFTGNLEIAPFFEIGGGIGVVYLGQVGPRGKATLSINIALDHNYQKVDLTGQAYFEIKALSFTLYEREFAHGTWNIYETGRTRAASLQSASENAYAAINMRIILQDGSAKLQRRLCKRRTTQIRNCAYCRQIPTQTRNRRLWTWTAQKSWCGFRTILPEPQ